jgi:hypothetical protein
LLSRLAHLWLPHEEILATAHNDAATNDTPAVRALAYYARLTQAPSPTIIRLYVYFSSVMRSYCYRRGDQLIVAEGSAE